MTTWGTCHFVSLAAAIRYYRDYGEDGEQILGKLERGEIRIGEPTDLKPGDRVVVIDDGTRYAIDDTMNDLRNMTQAIWNKTPEHQKEKLQDLSGLSPQLTGLEGWRVEVLTSYGETRRFIVGRSTGWRPCHIELKSRASTGGPSAEKLYDVVRTLYRAR